jgi:glycosyltransferase involved in cell wall biosynthesis
VQEPLVSIVVPCYNYGRFLGACLEAIFAQDGGHSFEVIVIDDASTDDTQDVLARYADPRLRAITHSKNRGHVASVSEGFLESRGRILARIDPDDRYKPWFLSETLARLRTYPEVGFVYGDAALIDEEGKVACETSDRIHKGRDFKGNEFIALLFENFVCAPTGIGRREAWLEAMPLPPNLAFNDWFFNLMIARRHEFYYISRVLAEYRVHSSNHHVKIVADRTEEPSIQYLLDWIFTETELDPILEKTKQAVRGEVYAAQYLTLAEKYFGFNMNKDARRCYMSAVRNRPSCLLRPGVARRFAATLIGRQWYEAGKSVLK